MGRTIYRQNVPQREAVLTRTMAGHVHTFNILSDLLVWVILVGKGLLRVLLLTLGQLFYFWFSGRIAKKIPKEPRIKIKIKLRKHQGISEKTNA